MSSAKRDIIQVDERWYVLATSSRADDRTRVLKHGDTFGLFDRYGDIHHLGVGEQGLYHEGTRFLSHFELQVNEQRPLLLNSTVKEDNTLLVVDLTTPDLYDGGRLLLRKGNLHIFRSKLLVNGAHYEHVRLLHYGHDPVTIDLALYFDADFADIFEVRGVQRERRGTLRPAQRRPQELVLSYEGLDRELRRTRVSINRVPDDAGDGYVSYRYALEPRQQEDLYITVRCEIGERVPVITGYARALEQAEADVARWQRSGAHIYTSNEQFNDWINRSAADLHMLMTQTAHGPYPYAGVPWFSTPFGRDGLITALQMLWLNPAIARGVLGFLAATQADTSAAARDAEPGKILHEMRSGEMAALGEVPFGRYYGSVDATPLFIVLAGAYYERTGDGEFIEFLWPHIEAALAWIDNHGDLDGDGFVEYARHSANGLVHQGWKDSEDAVFHADGTLAAAPIALCEVQGYVYAARMAVALLAEARGDPGYAAALRAAAAALKTRFHEAFWCEDIGAYALALDGDKRPCRVLSSNAGQTLWTGIADESHADRIAQALLSPIGFSGWGVRTLANTEKRYNPMSYHNGSIWPHDNALIALGLARYGLMDPAIKIMTGLFDASIALELHRLPELYCGFERLPGQGPTLYPVACLPQAWASGAVFQLLQACLGLSFAPSKPQLKFSHPRLPEYLQWLEIRGLQVSGGVVDLVVRRHAFDVGVNILRKDGDVEIAVIV